MADSLAGCGHVGKSVERQLDFLHHTVGLDEDFDDLLVVADVVPRQRAAAQFIEPLLRRPRRIAAFVSGAGLIEITFGLSAAADDLPAGATVNSKLYTLRLACPSATNDSPREAEWSHSYDTYKRLGGEVRLVNGRAVPPDSLVGSYNSPIDGGGSTQMSWRLCRNCPPPPPPSPPPPQPQRP